jgi:hypothetical protein
VLGAPASLIRSELSCQNHTQVRDYLVQHIDDNDQLIVADLGGNAAWQGFNEECSKWITNNLQA